MRWIMQEGDLEEAGGSSQPSIPVMARGTLDGPESLPASRSYWSELGEGGQMFVIPTGVTCPSTWTIHRSSPSPVTHLMGTSSTSVNSVWRPC